MSAHVFVLSVILFCGFFCAAFRSPLLFGRLLLPTSVLPIIAGIYSSATNLQTFLENGSPSGVSESAPWGGMVAECLQPLIVGSSLSGVFVVMSLIGLFLGGNAISQTSSNGKTP